MSLPISSPIHIAVFGMDNRARDILSMAFQGPGKGFCTLVDELAADAFIFNMDSVDALKTWQHYHTKYPDKPSIMLSVNNPNIADAIYVAKPIRVELLIEAITRVRPVKKSPPSEPVSTEEEIVLSEETPAAAPESALASPAPIFTGSQEEEKEFCGNHPDLDLTNPTERAQAFYKTSDYIQDQVFAAYRTAFKENVAVQIAVKINNRWELVTFLPSLNGVFTTLSDFQLRVVCTAPKYCTEIKLHRYSSSETQVLENGPRTKVSTQRVEPFLWKIALWTSRGRLPQGTSLTDPVKLKQWPNLTRLQPIPNGLRIATILMDQPRPLRLVAKVLKVPQRHVFAFYTAVHAIGLTMDAGNEVNAPAEQNTQKHKHHNLFSRILKRLTGSKVA